MIFTCSWCWCSHLPTDCLLAGSGGAGVRVRVGVQGQQVLPPGETWQHLAQVPNIHIWMTERGLVPLKVMPWEGQTSLHVSFPAGMYNLNSTWRNKDKPKMRNSLLIKKKTIVCKLMNGLKIKKGSGTVSA